MTDGEKRRALLKKLKEKQGREDDKQAVGGARERLRARMAARKAEAAGTEPEPELKAETSKEPEEAIVESSDGTADAVHRVRQESGVRILFARPRRPTRKQATPPAALAHRSRTQSPYVFDDVFACLPAHIQECLHHAAGCGPHTSVSDRLERLAAPEQLQLKELASGFISDLGAALNPRFLPAKPLDLIGTEDGGRLCLRTGTGHARATCRCWAFMFVLRRPLALPVDPIRATRAALANLLTFELREINDARLSSAFPVQLPSDCGAHYVRYTLDRGGWSSGRFAAAEVFTNGRVVIVVLEPRITKTQTGAPAPQTPSAAPEDFLKMIRRRELR